MNFIERILQEGFVEQSQKKLLELMPHKERWIPKWWEDYPFDKDWFGVNIDHPDAWFTKEDKELQLSLNGTLVSLKELPLSDDVLHLLNSHAVRYICLKDRDKVIYESFSGVVPSENIMNTFLQ